MTSEKLNALESESNFLKGFDMKRSLGAMFLVGGLLFAFFTMRFGSQQQMMAMEDGKPANSPDLNALPPVLTAAQVERLKRADSLSQLLKKLHPNMPLEVLPVGEAVLLRGDVWSQELHHQVVQISEQFYPKVLAQLQVEPSKLPRRNPANVETTKPILIGEDKHGLRETLGKLYPTATLEVNVLTESAVLIRGRVARQADIQPILDVAQQIVPKVLIYLTVDEPQSTATPGEGTDMLGPEALPGSGGTSWLPGTNVTPHDDLDVAIPDDAH